MKIALCFMTKDRVELSKQTFPRLLEAKNAGADIWWIDGSSTKEGEELPEKLKGANFFRSNVRGGPDAAVAYAVTECLRHDYDYIGIIENDVLLGEGWFKPTMNLFLKGIGLRPGAVSPRCYEDRVLFQRDGHNVMHNLGFGCVIWSRKAAKLMLKHMRTHLTLENRRTFAQLAGVDIGSYWAFRVHEGWVCADWGVDRVLAQHGLCSLALDPSPVEMIGQVPSLAEQGLAIATGRAFGFAHDTVATEVKFRQRQRHIREGKRPLPNSPALYRHGAGFMYFAHHLPGLPGYQCSGEWRLQWTQGFGPFGYRAAEAGAKIRVRVDGQCSIMASGYDRGGGVWVRDLETGYEVNPVLPGPVDGQGAIMALVVPGEIMSRVVEIEMEPGVVFFGVMTEYPQPMDPTYSFDHSVLPCV